MTVAVSQYTPAIQAYRQYVRSLMEDENIYLYKKEERKHLTNRNKSIYYVEAAEWLENGRTNRPEEMYKRLMRLFELNVCSTKWIFYEFCNLRKYLPYYDEFKLEGDKWTVLDRLVTEDENYVRRMSLDAQCDLFDKDKGQYIDDDMGYWCPLKNNEKEFEDIKYMSQLQKERLIELKDLLASIFFSTTTDRSKQVARARKRAREIQKELKDRYMLTDTHRKYINCMLSSKIPTSGIIPWLLRRIVRGTKNIFAAIGTFLTKVVPSPVVKWIRKIIDCGSDLATLTKVAKILFKATWIAKLAVVAFICALNRVVNFVLDKIISLLPLEWQVKVRQWIKRINKAITIATIVAAFKKLAEWVLTVLSRRELALAPFA